MTEAWMETAHRQRGCSKLLRTQTQFDVNFPEAEGIGLIVSPWVLDYANEDVATAAPCMTVCNEERAAVRRLLRSDRFAR
jgi:hypothetical protein